MLRLGLIGLGYWGPNYARVVTELPETSWRWSATPQLTPSIHQLARGGRARATTDPGEVFSADDVDAVVVATPTSTHYELALAALSPVSTCFAKSLSPPPSPSATN